MKTTTPMELLTLFHKSDFSDINLTVYEHKLLSVLLTFVNHDVSQGYKAWPATELLIKRTGIKTTTLTTARKSLLREGFLLGIKPNAGPGRSCVYYINPEKIIELAKKAGADHSGRYTPKIEKPVFKESHERNTIGLKQGASAPKPEPAQTFPAPVKEVEKAPGMNPDGSPPFWPNGERRYSYNDVMPSANTTPSKTDSHSYDDSSECPF